MRLLRLHRHWSRGPSDCLLGGGKASVLASIAPQAYGTPTQLPSFKQTNCSGLWTPEQELAAFFTGSSPGGEMKDESDELDEPEIQEFLLTALDVSLSFSVMPC